MPPALDRRSVPNERPSFEGGPPRQRPSIEGLPVDTLAAVRRLVVVATRGRARRQHALRRADAAAAALRRPLRPLEGGRRACSSPSYAAGTLVGGIPGGLAAARIGPRTAASDRPAHCRRWPASSSGSPATPWMLGVARFTQGVGGALSWAGAFSWIVASVPRARRGRSDRHGDGRRRGRRDARARDRRGRGPHERARDLPRVRADPVGPRARRPAAAGFGHAARRARARSRAACATAGCSAGSG